MSLISACRLAGPPEVFRIVHPPEKLITDLFVVLNFHLHLDMSHMINKAHDITVIDSIALH